ncbi:tRNA-splicing ligase RtcB/release factor H-coupled RctB family protein [Chitinophaga dinghuensis]|uniref:3'-phosphate/5'-hydroxy nucleic acid ligase n=1 Tax=Chitinophaga dinghuensis TaxID=1539050 RepID=A0A327VXU6_9BACT|nr:RtcB family protein [Chitinophaga dinghuensis]RAJ76582.1 tRNA-splicing ligase RtcB/release factor H-coupled RctB family protein [Chitinophaga dinghuensis]
MQTIAYYCDASSIEKNALEQLDQYAQLPFVQQICAFTDIHYCSEKGLPVGTAFTAADYFYPLITGKDIGCGVMYLKISKEYWLKAFDKEAHYRALYLAHSQMTDDGLGGGNHFLSLEEDDTAVYIICHTGTRDRGIALYQECLQLTRDYSREHGAAVNYVHRDFVDAGFYRYYAETIAYGYQRRKNFCLKTLSFLQQANYIRCEKSAIDRNYLRQQFSGYAATGVLHGTPYQLEDAVHNHLVFDGQTTVHRKGSTELMYGKTVVIPLSMSRGSLLVTVADKAKAAEALHSCAHGAGRQLSRFDAMKHWKTVLKAKERQAYKERFSELLNRSGEFPQGYIQEMDFAYKSSEDTLRYQPYLRKVTATRPIVTIKYSEI